MYTTCVKFCAFSEGKRIKPRTNSLGRDYTSSEKRSGTLEDGLGIELICCQQKNRRGKISRYNSPSTVGEPRVQRCERVSRNTAERYAYTMCTKLQQGQKMAAGAKTKIKPRTKLPHPLEGIKYIHPPSCHAFFRATSRCSGLI